MIAEVQRLAGSGLVPQPVIDAVNAVGWDGVVVPRMRVSDFMLYPVVRVLPEAWDEREQSGVAPQPHQFTLSLWESWQPDMGTPPPPSPVRIVGFVATGRLRATLRALVEMSGYAPGLALVTAARKPGVWATAEADVCDMNLAWATRDGTVTLLWAGRQEPAPTSAGRTTSVRHKEELVYARMLASDLRAPAASRAAIA